MLSLLRDLQITTGIIQVLEPSVLSVLRISEWYRFGTVDQYRRLAENLLKFVSLKDPSSDRNLGRNQRENHFAIFSQRLRKRDIS